MRVLPLIAFALFASSSVAWAQLAGPNDSPAVRDRTMSVEVGDAELAAAEVGAKRTLPDFLALLAAPRPAMNHFAVKVGFGDAPKEFFWLNTVKHDGDRFSARIADEPEYVKTLKFGQTVKFGRDEIVDWTYFDGDKMVGNYTACVLMRREAPDVAREFFQHYKLDCPKG